MACLWPLSGLGTSSPCTCLVPRSLCHPQVRQHQSFGLARASPSPRSHAEHGVSPGSCPVRGPFYTPSPQGELYILYCWETQHLSLGLGVSTSGAGEACLLSIPC